MPEVQYALSMLFTPTYNSLSVTQVKLDLADELQSAFPPGLRPYVQRVLVQATSYEQLKHLSDRLSGVPSAAALDLELPFGRKENLNLGTIKTFVRRAGLTERVSAVKYCCKSVIGTNLFPGSETPVSAELWPGYANSQPPAFWRNLLQHSLVELQITVCNPGHALQGLKAALRCGDRISGTLRCLQVDSIAGSFSLPMYEVTEFLAGLKLPCLTHLGFVGGVVSPFSSGCGWPQKESLPVLQSFGGTQKPAGIFGLGMSGINVCFEGALVFDRMAAMAGSALGPAIRELHIKVVDIEQTWDGLPAAMPFRSVLGFIALLRSVQQLSIEGWQGIQVHVNAEAINALDGLQKLALRHVTMEGDLTGPRLTQIVCLSLRTRLLTVLARPPPALASVLVPHVIKAVVPQAVLGVHVPWGTAVVSACPGGPRWEVSHKTCQLWDWHNLLGGQICGLVTAVPCR